MMNCFRGFSSDFVDVTQNRLNLCLLFTPLLSCLFPLRFFKYSSSSSGQGHVISVLRAVYGRQDKITCSYGRPASQIQNDHCSRLSGKVIFMMISSLLSELFPLSFSNSSSASGEGHTLSVLRADYGRHDKTTCTSTRPFFQTQYTCCSGPTGKVAERCNGRMSCSIKASNSEFGDPCRGTYKYLDVTYTCEGKQLREALTSISLRQH
uniref:SUEL-type lectin domain-containing protein n=1 Tax=Acanthochromis polyacanthus TaxID=80966 RepID=A0A3Q1EY80_9TELE